MAIRAKQGMRTKRPVVVFRALANTNRLRIIGMLLGGKRMTVTDIAVELHISFTATSNHLAILKSLDVLEALGTAGHVFYSMNEHLPHDFRSIVAVALQK